MENNISLYIKETQEAENEVKILKKELEQLKLCIQNRDFLIANPEHTKLNTDNTKLKHRLSILNRAIMAESSKTKLSNSDNFQTISDMLYNLFSAAISAACSDIVEAPIDIALSGNNPKFGDYQCNSALQIANLYKQMGKKVNPREIGKKIVENVPSHELISKLELAGPGFINIYLKKEFAVKMLTKLLNHGLKPTSIQKKLKIIVDFASPNIAKEMHVGHLRSTIIGDSICRLLEYLGHTVIRLNHVGDWGTQFGMLIAYLQEKFPNYLISPPPISDLQELYKESKKRFDEDEEFKKRAYSCVVKLQSFDPDHKKAWEHICNISRKEFQKIFDRLDVSIIDRGESFYQNRMEQVVEELEHGGFLHEDEGRKVMWGDGTVPLTVVKSDGGFTYDTSDLACMKQRVFEEKADWIIYITDAGQATHFHTVFQCSKKAGILNDKVRTTHIGFGVVLGENKKKFKTRSGDTIKLHDLLDEGLKRALDKLKEKERDKVLTPEELKKAQESIAYGCIKYADLSHNRNHEYVFSFDKMLEDKGNTAVYLLYAYTRIKSIARNANLTPEKIRELAKTHQVSLDDDKGWKLGKVLIRFPDVILKAADDLYLHTLCEYLYDIATTFTEFYDSCYCIEKDASGDVVNVNVGRILLVEVAALIMATCFDILGIKPVSKM